MTKHKHIHMVAIVLLLTLATTSFGAQIQKTHAGNAPTTVGNTDSGSAVPDLSAIASHTLESGQITPRVSFLGDDGFGYIATATTPAQIERINIKNSFAHDSTLTLQNSDGQIIGGFADGAYGYFITDANPGKIFKVELDNLTIQATLNLDAQYGQIKGFALGPNNHALFSSHNSTTPASFGVQMLVDSDNSTNDFVTQVTDTTDAIFTNASNITSLLSANTVSPTSAVAFDVTDSILYVGLDDQSILAISFAHNFPPTNVSFATVNGTQIYGALAHAFWNAGNDKVYIATGAGTPSQLIQIDPTISIDASTATVISLTASQVAGFAYDSTAQLAFFGSNSGSSSTLSEVDLPSLTETSTLTLNGTYLHNLTMFTNPTASTLYVAAGDNNSDPGIVEKISYSKDRSGAIHGYQVHSDNNMNIDTFNFYSHYDGSKGDKNVVIALYDNSTPKNLIWYSNPVVINNTNSFETTQAPISVQTSAGTTSNGYDLTNLPSGYYNLAFETDTSKQTVGLLTSNQNPTAFDLTPDGYSFGSFPSTITGASPSNDEWAIYMTMGGNNGGGGGGGPDLSGASGNFMAADLLGQVNGETQQWTNYSSNNGAQSTNAQGFQIPTGSYVDRTNNRLFVSDAVNDRVLVFNLDGSGNLVDHTADYVIGQPDFTTVNSGNTQNEFATMTQHGGGPFGITYDPTRQLLFVADTFNGRILVFDASPSTLATNRTNNTAENATYVIGQHSFTSTDSGVTDHTLIPVGMSLDTTNHRLFVSDAFENRVMVFNIATANLNDCATGVTEQTPAAECYANGQDVSLKADYVLGQTDKVSSDSGNSASQLYQPLGTAYDGSKYLYVVDSKNNRILAYDVSSNMADGKAASFVIGQSDYGVSHIASNDGAGDGNANSHGFSEPSSIYVDPTSNVLYVDDTVLGDGSGNGRVMMFNVAASGTTNSDHLQNDEHAFQVIGKPDFTSTGINVTRSALTSSFGMSIDTAKHRIYAPDFSANRVLIFDYIKSSLSLPSHVTANSSYTSDPPTTTQHQGTVSYVVSSGSLPTGLTINSHTGILSGTPTTAGDYSFTIRAKDTIDGGFYFDDHAYSMTVDPAQDNNQDNNNNQQNNQQQGGGIMPMFLTSMQNPAVTGDSTSSGSSMHGSATTPSCDPTTRAGKDAPFTDITDGKTRTYVTALYQQCAVDGKDSKTFDPNSNLTRAEAVKIIVEIAKFQQSAFHGVFRDVAANNWFAQYVTTAVDNNLIKGFTEDNNLLPSFKPNDTITRAEALKILLLAKGTDVPEVTTNNFADVNPTDWYYNITNYALSQKIVQGYTTDSGLMFKPNAPITRAELAKMAYLVFGLNQ